jgi:sterol 24-C-methyltransferase
MTATSSPAARALEEPEQVQRASMHAGRAESARIVDRYYTVATNFYEFGWGQSFHFGPRFVGETLRESLLRHEYSLALRMGLRPGMHVLDVGCGVGGPMRNIARFADVEVTGITINAYQVRRAEIHNATAGLTDRCRAICGDFRDIPSADATFDAAFAIEATCHAPDLHDVFSEVLRVLRPGGAFAGYDWCLTDRYDAGDPRHRQLSKSIEEADALAPLRRGHELGEALCASGFELVECRDVAGDGSPQRPWYLPLTRHERGVRGLRASPGGRVATRLAIPALEAVRIAPRGSRWVHAMLARAADALVASGELGIFTPAQFFLARRPPADRHE